MTVLFAQDTRRKAKPHQWEEEMQIALFERIFMNEVRFPQLGHIVHTPNGGYRSKREAGRFMQMGVRSGFPDLVCHTPGFFSLGGKWEAWYRGLAIELKCGRNSPSMQQWEWLDYFASLGYLTLVVWDRWEDVWNVIKEYFALDIKERIV